MFGLAHLFALSIYGVCGLSLALGVVVFVRNAIRRGDVEYEARFPWWVRLPLYILVLVIPPAAVDGQDMSLNASVWTNFLLGTVALAIPPIGLLGSLGLLAFRRTRERVKLGKGLLFVSLVPIVLWIGISLDPATRQIVSTWCQPSSAFYHSAVYWLTEQQNGMPPFSRC
jgi:hypothetical protein